MSGALMGTLLFTAALAQEVQHTAGGAILTAPELPLGGHPCTLRVIRAGGHNTIWWAVRSHYRGDHDQGRATDEIGFRVARSVVPAAGPPQAGGEAGEGGRAEALKKR